MISKANKKLIKFSDRNIQMMNEIATKGGWATATEIVKRGIEELHMKYFRYNKPALDEKLVIKTAQVKARAKVEAQKTKEDMRLEEKIKVCTQTLKGEVQNNMCMFTQYAVLPSGDKKMEVPLTQVDPVLAENSLFLPSKEAVLKARHALKKVFKSK
jgi:hypothetical protein